MVVINKEIIDEPYEQEECIDYEQLKKRMWKDRVLLQKLKEKREKQEPDVEAKQEASRRKKMSRAQDSVLKYMVKIMEDCNAQGFVYGIIPEKGKPVSSYSDSLREWWKDQIRFDQNAPVAISKYLPVLENDLDITKDSATWSKVMIQEEAWLGLTDKCLKISASNQEEEDDIAQGLKRKGAFGFGDAALDTMYACQNVEFPQSEDDWMNVAVQNDVSLGEDAGGSGTLEDDPCYWLNSVENLELQAALELLVRDNVDFAPNIPQGQEDAASASDLGTHPPQQG
ncbi:hypothetical protein JHK82_032205 [Glycine max]|nr:hypothetical protein JHK82_032205 [Glycine max]